MMCKTYIDAANHNNHRAKVLLCFLLACALIGLLGVLSGCNSETSWGGTGTVEALRIEPMGGGASSGGIPLPNITMGGGSSSFAKTVTGEDKPQMHVSYNKTILGQIFGIGASSFSCSYVGTKSETATQTRDRLGAMAGLVDSANDLGEVDSGVAELSQTVKEGVSTK